MSELCAAKQEIVERVRASLAYLPDDASGAESERPWLARQLNMILDDISYEDLHMYELMSCIALLGPVLSRVLSRGEPPDSTSARLPLRAV